MADVRQFRTGEEEIGPNMTKQSPLCGLELSLFKFGVHQCVPPNEI